MDGHGIHAVLLGTLLALVLRASCIVGTLNIPALIALIVLGKMRIDMHIVIWKHGVTKIIYMLCYDMAQQFGHAQLVWYALNGTRVVEGEYTDQD